MTRQLHSKTVIGFKKTNVFFMIVMTFLSMGIYTAYWFLSRRRSFSKLAGGKDWIPYKWWWFMLIFTIISLIYTLLGEAIFTDFGLAILDSYNVILSFYFVGLVYYSTFRAREMIESHVDENIYKPWLLVLFQIWYIQYKVNRIEEGVKE